MSYRNIRQRAMAMGSIRKILANTYDLYPNQIDFEKKQSAVVIQYTGDSSDERPLLEDNFLGVLVSCGVGLRDTGWPDDIEKVIGIAVFPEDTGASNPQAIRWSASVEWLEEALKEELDGAVLQKQAMETAEWVYNDGTTEKAETDITLVE